MQMKKAEVCCELSALLRPKTYPFGVKFFENLNERPSGTMRPRHPMNACQITALARYYGRSMYFTAEDMACIVGGVTLGLLQEPESMKNGKIAKMLHADLESAKEFTTTVPKIPYGKVKGADGSVSQLVGNGACVPIPLLKPMSNTTSHWDCPVSEIERRRTHKTMRSASHFHTICTMKS